MRYTIKRGFTLIELLISMALISFIVTAAAISYRQWSLNLRTTDPYELDSIMTTAKDTLSAHPADALTYTLEYIKLNFKGVTYNKKTDYKIIDLAKSNINDIDNSKALNIVYNSTTFMTDYTTLTKPYTTILYINSSTHTVYLLYSVKAGSFDLYNKWKM